MHLPTTLSLLILGQTLLLSTLLAQSAPLPSERLLLAEGLYKRAFYKEAIPELRSLIQSGDLSTERQAQLSLYLADALTQTQQSEAAIPLLQVLVTQSAQPAARDAIRLQLARAYLQTNQPNQAITQIQAITESLAQDLIPTKLDCLAQSYRQLGRLTEAIDTYKKLAASSKPHFIQASFQAAELLAKDPTDKQAIRDATGIYYDLSLQATDPQQAAQALGAAAMLTYTTQHFTESARLHIELARKHPQQFQQMTLVRSAIWSCIKANRLLDAQSLLHTFTHTSDLPADEKLYIQATIARQVQKYPEATIAYQQLISTYPQSTLIPYVATEWVNMLYATQDYDTLTKQGLTLVDQAPIEQRESLLVMILDGMITLKRQDQAIDLANRITQTYPTSSLLPTIAYRIAWMQLTNHAYPQAAKALLKLVADHPKSPLVPEALYSAAYAWAQAEQFAQSNAVIATITTTYPSAPSYLQALFLKANNEIRLDQPARAAATLDEYLSKSPQNKDAAQAYYLRAMLYFGSSDFHLAITTFKKAHTLGLPFAQAQEAAIKLAQAYYHIKAYEQAADTLLPLINAAQINTIPISYLAWVASFWIEQGKFVEAETVTRSMLKQATDPADIGLTYYYLGTINEKQGNKASALDAYMQAIAHAPQSPSLSDVQASIALADLLLQDEPSTAKSHYLRVLTRTQSTQDPQLNRSRALAYQGLAILAQKEGDKQAALRYNMNLIILFDDDHIVPAAFKRAIELVATQAERDQLLAELKQRYPQSTPPRHPPTDRHL